MRARTFGWATRAGLVAAAAITRRLTFMAPRLAQITSLARSPLGHYFSRRIGANITFDKVAREWRCKYAADASGGPADSASLKAAEELLQSYLPTLKALPNAEVTRVMCGGCHDFKIVVNQPCADHDAWKAADYAPEQEFIAKLSAIEGVSQVETQEYTCQPL